MKLVRSPSPILLPPPHLSGNRIKLEEGGGEGRKEKDHKQRRASDAGEWCGRDHPHHCMSKHMTLLRKPMSASITWGPSAACGL